MSNEMVEIKNQVVESSKNFFLHFKMKQPPQSQPPDIISNVEYNQDDEEEESALYAE